MKTKLYQDVEEVVLALQKSVYLLQKVWLQDPDEMNEDNDIRPEVARVFRMWGRHPKNWEKPYNTIIARVKENEEFIDGMKKKGLLIKPAGDEEGLLSRVEEAKKDRDRSTKQVQEMLNHPGLHDFQPTLVEGFGSLLCQQCQQTRKEGNHIYTGGKGNRLHRETGSLYDSGFSIGQTIRLNAQIPDSVLRGIADGVEPGDMDAESMAKRRRER